MFSLEQVSARSQARRGRLQTTHGELTTPFFMTIATKGAVRGLSVADLETVHVPIVLANTYHLLVRPGREAMRARGGLHAWMGWNKPILTDSGGYQVFSLANSRKVTEEGVVFQSHIDGARVSLTPEESIATQQAIGSDMMMQLDVVEPPDAARVRVEEAADRSVRWAERSKSYLDAHRGDSITKNQQLFGIVQGGLFEDLRQRSIAALVDLDLDGYAIGGLSVGESWEENARVAAFVAERLPQNKPRYFMGGGLPEQIVAHVRMGVDMFDCVIPTRHARHGALFVWNGESSPVRLLDPDFYLILNIDNAVHRTNDAPVDSFDDAPASRCSHSYLHHLFANKEILGLRLATEHNVRFYMRLMELIRQGIEEGVL